MQKADYSELKESFIIFICLDDPFDAGLPVYTFERKCREYEKVDLKDETHHVIFNAAAYESEVNAEIKEFLAFVKNNKADSDFTRRIENMVETKKFEQSFVNEYMAWNLHDRDVLRRGMAEGIAQGIAQGTRNKAIETATVLKQSGVDKALIAKSTGLSLEEIETL